MSGLCLSTFFHKYGDVIWERDEGQIEARRRVDAVASARRSSEEMAIVPPQPGGRRRGVCKPTRALELALLPAWLFLQVSCSHPAGPATIRLVEEFDKAQVSGQPTAVPSIEPTEWRDGASQDWTNWKAGPGVGSLKVKEGALKCLTTDSVPILHLSTQDTQDPDVLHSIEIRMRASAGANLGIRLESSEELRLDEIVKRSRETTSAWRLNSPLISDGSLHTYSISVEGVTSASIPSSKIRHILVRPTDAAGAEIEIESVRLIFRREYLVNIPSGVSWQGFQDIFRETLVSRSPEQITYHLRLPQQPWLDLSLATAQYGPVTFKLAIQGEDSSEQLLLKQTVTTPHRWEPAPVPLGKFGGQQVTIVLSAEAEEEGILAFWGAPVIRDRLPSVAQNGSLETPQGVILIVGDTLRRDHLSPYGYKRSTAPYLTRMASEGVLFRDAQSQGSWTKVSVPSILTSLYASTHGISDVTHRIPASVTTLAEVYQQAGYATWGSSSVAFSGRMTNLHQGVEVLHERASLEEAGSKTARSFTDRLLPWLSAHRDTPFFVFLHVFDPHSPFEPRPPFDSMWTDPTRREAFERDMESVRKQIASQNRRRRGMPHQEEIDRAGVDAGPFIRFQRDWYDGSIRGMDVELGRVLERLDQLGLTQKTAIAFISDHGEEFLEHGRQWHGNTVYGEMINVPMLLHWPGHLPQGRIVEETVQSIDLMPTLLALSGLGTPKDVQGENLLGLIHDDKEAAERFRNRPVFSERAIPPSEIESQDVGSQVASLAIVQDGWKLIKNMQRPEDFPAVELYNHREDPLNLKNVAASQPEVVEKLLAQLNEWHESALAARVNSDTDAEGLSPDELKRLRSLGYIQ